MNAIKNITIGHTERLRKPVGYTVLANLVNIIPFMLSIEVVNILFALLTAAGRDRTCNGCGSSSVSLSPICSSWLWPKDRHTDITSAEPTK